MKKFSTYLFPVLIFAITSCAVDYKYIPPVTTCQAAGFQVNLQDSIKYGFFKDVLECSGNKHLIRWAKRHNYQIIGMEVVNMSGKFRKGFQLHYFNGNEQLTTVNSGWFANKARQKMSGAPFLAIPFIILEEAIFPHNDYPKDANGFVLYPEYNQSITCSVVENDKKRRKHANAELLSDLRKHDFSYKVLPTGKSIYGIVIFNQPVSLDSLSVEIDDMSDSNYHLGITSK